MGNKDLNKNRGEAEVFIQWSLLAIKTRLRFVLYLYPLHNDYTP